MEESRFKSKWCYLAPIALAGFGLFCVYHKYKHYKMNSFKVIHVDWKPLEHIESEQLIQNAYMLAQQAYENVIRDGRANNQVASTLYSLYKQTGEGDADEFARNREVTKPERYAVWLQQAGKSDDQCMKEYIILVGQCDPHFNETVKNIANGTIKEINFQAAGTGNPFEKTVPLPSKPDDSAYINDLDGRDKELFEIYSRLDVNESQLVKLVRLGTIKPNEKDKEGQTPLMHSIDNNYSKETIKALIDLGCDVNASDKYGMTALHKSYWCENEENFKLLLSSGADHEIADNEGDTAKSLADDNPAFKKSLTKILGDQLATSMTRTQFNQVQQKSDEPEAPLDAE